VTAPDLDSLAEAGDALEQALWGYYYALDLAVRKGAENVRDATEDKRIAFHRALAIFTGRASLLVRAAENDRTE
jgi:hypothetical protein